MAAIKAIKEDFLRSHWRLSPCSGGGHRNKWLWPSPGRPAPSGIGPPRPAPAAATKPSGLLKIFLGFS